MKDINRFHYEIIYQQRSDKWLSIHIKKPNNMISSLISIITHFFIEFFF